MYKFNSVSSKLILEVCVTCSVHKGILILPFKIVGSKLREVGVAASDLKLELASLICSNKGIYEMYATWV